MRYLLPVLGLLSFSLIFAATPQPVFAQKTVGGPIASVPGLIREAMQTADQISDPGAKAAALAEIGTARVQAGNRAGGKQSFAEARHFA